MSDRVQEQIVVELGPDADSLTDYSCDFSEFVIEKTRATVTKAPTPGQAFGGTAQFTVGSIEGGQRDTTNASAKSAPPRLLTRLRVVCRDQRGAKRRGAEHRAQLGDQAVLHCCRADSAGCFDS